MSYPSRTTTQIRRYVDGEELSLRQVFESSVRGIAADYYTPAQIEAWAPTQCDQREWQMRIKAIRPWVFQLANEIVGYADVQASGYIDHFFVSCSHSKRGIGSALMKHLEIVALTQGSQELFAEVSLAAETFFAKHGFQLEERLHPVIHGVSLSNARMRKKLQIASK